MKALEVIAEITESCPECEGTGIVYAPRCELCGHMVDGPERDTIYAAMHNASRQGVPIVLGCGHPLASMREEWPCRECGGKGVRTRKQEEGHEDAITVLQRSLASQSRSLSDLYRDLEALTRRVKVLEDQARRRWQDVCAVEDRVDYLERHAPPSHR